MRYLLSFLGVLLLAATCSAQDVAVARAKAQAILTLRAIGCGDHCVVAAPPTCGPDCAAKINASLLLARIARERGECMTDWDAAFARAEKTGKPVFLWVGMTCERTIRGQFPDAVHVHLQEMNGNSTPRLLVGQAAQKQFSLFPRTGFTERTPTLIRDALKQKQQTSQAAPPSVSLESC